MSKKLDSSGSRSESLGALRERSDRLARGGWSWLKPRLRQLLYNLRVWLPILSNRGIDGRTVRYWGREHRRGLVWQIALPAQCWKSGQTEGLLRREYVRQVRGFEQPVPILGVAATVVLIGLLLFVWIPSIYTFLLLLTATVAGPALLWLRSWTEEVHLIIFTTAENEPLLRCPDIVVDQNELFLFLPTAALAEAAMAELAATRRRAARKRGGHGTVAEPPTGSPDEPPRQHYGFFRPKPVDLPPIPLDDDDSSDTSSVKPDQD